MSGCRYDFPAFPLARDIIQNFEIGSVSTKLQRAKLDDFWRIGQNYIIVDHLPDLVISLGFKQ